VLSVILLDKVVDYNNHMHVNRYQSIFRSEEQNWWYKGRRSLITQILNNVSIRKNSTILDIGCGTGRNIMLFQKYGSPFGVDTSNTAIDICNTRKLSNVHLIQGNHYPFEDNSFDVVTCLDVLEHEKNEYELLMEASRVVKKGGYIILAVPATPLLWSKLDTDSHHVRRYTKSTLQDVLEKTQFIIKRISYYNYLLFLPVLLIRIIQKTNWGKGLSWGIRPDFESPFLNRMLEPIFALDIRLLRYLSPPFGVSLFAIAQKKS